MRRLFLALFFAAGGTVAYQQIVLEAPVRVYRLFADAWAREDTPTAAALTEGDAAKRAVESQILRGVATVPMEAFRGTRHEIDSRLEAPGGDVVITAREVVLYDPPGITSALGGAAAADFRHIARLRKTSSGWRVVDWKPEFLQARPTRPR